MEEWPRGLRHTVANCAYLDWYRGFESLLFLRIFIKHGWQSSYAQVCKTYLGGAYPTPCYTILMIIQCSPYMTEVNYCWAGLVKTSNSGCWSRFDSCCKNQITKTNCLTVGEW